MKRLVCNDGVYPGMSYAELQTVIHGLRVAADRFKEDASNARAAGFPSLAEQFDRQENDSRALADRLEE